MGLGAGPVMFLASLHSCLPLLPYLTSDPTIGYTKL
jgi:hypothetical protein